MKKNYLFGMFALAAMTMVGCSNDEVVNDYSQDNAIEFGTYVGRGVQSRGSVEDIASIATKGFGVFAFYTDNGKYGANETYPSFTANFMKNQQVTGAEVTGTEEQTTYTWTYSPVKYWPNESTDYLSFLAYAPYDASYELGTDKTISFNVANTVTDQIDFLYCSNAGELANLSKQSVGDKVTFEFDHALTRVGFKAKLMVDLVNPDGNGTTDDADDDGTIALGNETTVAISQVKFGYMPTGGKFNIETGTWSEHNLSTTNVYTLGADNLQNNTDIESITTPTVNINKDDSYLMLVPAAGQVPCWVEVTYTVTTVDTNLDSGSSVITNVIKSNFTNQGILQQGIAYNLVLHIGLTSVKVDVEVGDWDESTDIEVNVPNNK